MRHYDKAALDGLLASAKARGFESFAKAVPLAFEEMEPEDLAGINANRFARGYGLDPRQTLLAFFHFTKAGVFDLLWIVHCPHCASPVQTARHLGSLRGDSFCPVCDAGFRAGFDSSVHLAFRAAESIAKLDGLDPMAVAMAGFEEEAGVAFALERGARRALDHPLIPGNYLLADRARGASLGMEVLEDPAEERGEFLWRLTPETMGPLVIHRKPGRIRLLLHNDSPFDRELHFARLRKPDWPDATSVAALREFRDFFAEERISPEESFEIRRLALLFTDIKGSTAMYERLGDATAFDIVRAHFGIMEDIVTRTQGSLVKTIGDAVMATFARSADAVVAARDMIDAFDRFNTESRAKSDVIVKIGIHAGPCIAVALNDRLDYFGGAVNLAARIQGLSDGRDLMMSAELLDEPGVRRAIPETGWTVEEFSIGLKGIEGERKVLKIAKSGDRG